MHSTHWRCPLTCWHGRELSCSAGSFSRAQLPYSSPLLRRAASLPGAWLWGPGSLGRYAPPPFTPDAGPRRSPRRTCRAYLHAHLGLVGLDQLLAHADCRLVARVGVAQQQHSWVRARTWGSGGLDFPTATPPACFALRTRSLTRLFVFFRAAWQAWRPRNAAAFVGLSLGRVPPHVRRRRVNFGGSLGITAAFSTIEPLT